jgi:hypothetical protein
VADRSWRLTWSAGWIAVDVEGDRAMVGLQIAAGDQFLVLQEDTDAPTGRDLDVRGEGLWLSVVKEDPVRWSVNVEAYALLVDATQEDLGIPTALAVDAEWESGRLIGQLVVGDVRVPLDEPANWELTEKTGSGS